MNDKLKKHVDILFAAAPKNQKTAEIKEELLTNLNDKYNDLLSNGYDTTAAFHIALSGIGDIDELLRECGEPMRTSTTVIPAQAGIQTEDVNINSLDPRLRGMTVFRGLGSFTGFFPDYLAFSQLCCIMGGDFVATFLSRFPSFCKRKENHVR